MQVQAETTQEPAVVLARQVDRAVLRGTTYSQAVRQVARQTGVPAQAVRRGIAESHAAKRQARKGY
jgi:hypothetical protein